ncbi:patatin-domain-containing protein [Russula brevipes]|nr:patatin-domain-containing protein [Russula brevipes]
MEGTLAAHLQTMEHTDRHPIVSFISALFWVVLYLLSWVKTLAALVTISVPHLVYSLLSYSMTLTVPQLLVVCHVVLLWAVALNYWIRFRYLNTYAQLKEPPLLKPDAQELHPDVNTTETPPAFHTYLDEFLQAVRIFGFLEKPVFHELARYLQTRRLIAGDTLSLDEDRSFYCVIDGMVQVYAPSGKPTESRSGSWDNEDMNGYGLMNEVGSGGTLSSLFTILSLFTEDVETSWQGCGVSHGALSGRSKRANSDVSQMDLDGHAQYTQAERKRELNSRTPFTSRNAERPTPTALNPRSQRRTSNHLTQIHHGTVARATEDTTLAVIPAEAFRRLTKKFPNASAHIVQVIMTRFSRVTFNAAHKYLGLTTEVLRTEKAINDIACHPLPPIFYEGGGMQQLRQRFDGVGGPDFSSSQPELGGDYYKASPTPVSPKPSTQSRLSSKEASAISPVKLPGSVEFPSRSSRSTRHLVQAGDLHSSTTFGEGYRPLGRSFSILNTPRPPRRELYETPEFLHFDGVDFDLRQEVMNCIAVSIGLSQPPMSDDPSVEASPSFSAMDSGRSRPGGSILESPFGTLSLLDIGDDSSSATGGSSSVTASGSMNGLDNEVEILFFSSGSYLAKAGERDIGLFFVIEGFLDIVLPTERRSHPEHESRPRPPSSSLDSLYDVETTSSGDSNISGVGSPKESTKPHAPSASRPSSSTKDRRPLFTVKPGGIAGYLASLSNAASYVDIVAKTDTYVGFLPHHALQRLLEKRPIVLLTLAKRLISLLSPLVLQIDASLDWMHVNAGQVLWRTGDVSDSFYIVINGRLRAITEDRGVVKIVAEYGQDDTAGEIDVITSTPRRNTVHAIRDTELIRMPQTLFNAISSRNPQTTALLLRMIASRVRSEIDSSPRARSRNMGTEFRRNNDNLKTVALLPVSRNVPIEGVARKLHTALEGIGAPTSYLNQVSVSNALGRHAFTRMGKLKTAAWLADQEQRYKIVLYVADSSVGSSWTQTCIRQADYVLVVGLGDDSSTGEYERLLLSMKTTARKELVLLHPERSVLPGSTREWLKVRDTRLRHLLPYRNLQELRASMPKPAATAPQNPAAVAALKNFRDRVQSRIKKYRGSAPDVRAQRLPRTDDFARLARRICGISIGLVLGGGGARGISHLGVLRALEDNGVPIDHIGGTSIGGLIGGLYAKEFSGRMGNIWRMLSDVTYPLVAYTTGHEFNRSLYKAFYDLHIEDMWLPFFCNTANITTSRMEIHETGYAWRFIRASMSLVGLVPPLCDNGNMLVSTMFDMGASAVIASDVGSLDDNSPRNFGDTISGWWLMIMRWNPFSNARTIPAITEIQSRLAYVSSVQTLEEAKVTRGCLYIAMPVQEYGTLQWGKFEEIQEKGYQAATKILEEWEEEGKLPLGIIEGKDANGKRKKGRSARRNTI